MKNLMTSILFLFSFILWSQQQIPGINQNKSILLCNAKIITGIGTNIDNGCLGFENGKINYIGPSKPLTEYEINIDLEKKHIYPGFIALNSTLGLVEIDAVRASDDEREIGTYNPNVRSIIAYNAESKIVETMRLNGVLLAQITPRGGVISGSSSVVQLDAWNWQDATIKHDQGLHISWPSFYSYSGSWWSSGTRTLKSSENYTDQVENLKNVFNNAKSYVHDPEKSDLKLLSMQGLFSGNQTLFLNAQEQRQITDAIIFFKSIGVKKLVIIGGREATDISDLILKHDVYVVASHPHRLPSSEDSHLKEAFNLARNLHSKGINFSIDTSGSMERANTRNLPFYAGSFVGNGLDYDSAIKALTINAARILGIDSMYGSLEIGKSATLFVSDGDALDMKTNVISHAYIDGRNLQLENHQTKLRDKFLEKVSRNN